MQIILAALTLATADAAVQQLQEPKAEIQAVQNLFFHDSVEQVRQDYADGKYRDTFNELNDSYNEVRQDDGLKALAEMRLGFTSMHSSWEQAMKEALKERNQELILAVKDDHSPLSEKVKLATQPLDPEVESSYEMLARLQTLAPGQGSNDDENAIIAIDFEYEYKAIHLDLPIVYGQKGNNLWEKQIALKMEKMDRMLEASKSFQDASLKKAIETIHSHFDALLTQSSHIGDLTRIARNPTTPLEEKITSILMKYREKFADLSKEFLETRAIVNEQN